VTVLVVGVSSHNDHPIDYVAVREAGVGGAIVKLTEGADALAYVNPYAAVDVTGFRDAGLPVAGYHFLHPSIPVADQLALLEGHLEGVHFVWVNSEVTEGTWPDVAMATRAMCEAITGGDLGTGLYSNPAFLSDTAGAPWGYPLWLADYGPTSPPQRCNLWQFTDSGSVEGISGPVDLSHFYGTSGGLAKLFAHVGPSLASRHVSNPEDDMIWLDTDPNNGDAILVVPGQGGWHGIGAEELAYYRSNGVPEASEKITKAVFDLLHKLG